MNMLQESPPEWLSHFVSGEVPGNGDFKTPEMDNWAVKKEPGCLGYTEGKQKLMFFLGQTTCPPGVLIVS